MLALLLVNQVSSYCTTCTVLYSKIDAGQNGAIVMKCKRHNLAMEASSELQLGVYCLHYIDIRSLIGTHCGLIYQIQTLYESFETCRCVANRIRHDSVYIFFSKSFRHVAENRKSQ